jgi:hypothetical protein
MNLVFVWPLVTFSHTKHVFGSEFSNHQVTKSVNKCDRMLFKVKECVVCVTIDHPLAT